MVSMRQRRSISHIHTELVDERLQPTEAAFDQRGDTTSGASNFPP
jgi:hypothetical protein